MNGNRQHTESPAKASLTFGEIVDALRERETVKLRPAGHSMWPGIQPECDELLLGRVRAGELKPGDIVLAPVLEPHSVFLHRLVAIEGDIAVMMGDSNVNQRERCPLALVAAKVVGIERDGKTVNLDSFTRRILRKVYLWPKLPRRIVVSAMKRLGNFKKL